MKVEDKLSFNDFNVDKPVKTTSRPAEEAWNTDKEEEGEEQDVEEAVCVICDEIFDADPNRPPILCSTCKKGLKKLLNPPIETTEE